MVLLIQKSDNRFRRQVQYMQTCEKNNPLKKEETDPSDEAFKLLIKDLLYYNEALKSCLDQIDLGGKLGEY
jgi:hypothetical protein